MLFGTKRTKITADEIASSLLQDEAVDRDALTFVKWKVGKEEFRRALAEGDYRIGMNTPFADISLPGEDKVICAVLSIRKKESTLRCLATKPTIFVEGSKLQQGSSVHVGDFIETVFGRTPLTIFAAAVGSAPDHMRDRHQQRKVTHESLHDPDQEAVDDTFADLDQLKQLLSKKLLQALDMEQIKLEHIRSPKVRERTRLKLRKMISRLKFPEGYALTPSEVEQQVFDEVMGLGPLEPLLADDTVTEIMVNRRDQIYIEKSGKLVTAPISFSSDQALLNVIERIVSTVGRRIDQSRPLVDARLLDGSRVNAVIPPLALKGPNLTIRRFSKTPITLNQLIKWNSLDATMADFLRHIVESHKNLMISGGTGSGKTTLLNALSKFIPDDERIITVEDAAELQLQQPHVITLESKPANLEGEGAVTIRDLVKNTLRMRPDRIIVGECRGAEALDMLQAMNTGHDGSMTTAHANSPEDMLRRLETMVMMAGMELPLRAIREQIASALTIVCQQQRRKDGFRRVTSIAWVKGLDRQSGEYQVIDLMSRGDADQVIFHRQALEQFWESEEIPSGPDEILGDLLSPVPAKSAKSGVRRAKASGANRPVAKRARAPRNSHKVTP